MDKYIKNKSDVSSKFILDFFDLNKEYDPKKYLIDFQRITEWISLPRENLKDTIISKFEKNYDYRQDSEKMILTPNCFKELCTILQTTKSKEIRKNYIEIENLIYKYKYKKRNNKENIIYIYNLIKSESDSKKTPPKYSDFYAPYLCLAFCTILVFIIILCALITIISD